jgi:hypothetical protein
VARDLSTQSPPRHEFKSNLLPPTHGYQLVIPTGMGGFDSKGSSWQYKLSPEDSRACARQNNSLEFVATLITVWLSARRNDKEAEHCFLALSDNSSTVGWLHKANVDDSKNLPLHMATRKFAEGLLEADCCLYSQHIAGEKNIVADFLSRKFHLNHNDLTSLILTSFPSQVPPLFRVSPLPPTILSWLTSWLQRCKERVGSPRILGTRKQECGEDESNTQNVLTLTKMCGFSDLPQIAEQSYSVPLLQPCDGGSFPDPTIQIWRRQQYKRPLQNWVRFLRHPVNIQKSKEIDEQKFYVLETLDSITYEIKISQIK